MEHLTVPITTEYIKLDQLLKFSGLAESGAEAKDMVLSEMILIDGDVCIMRGKKLRAGDSITVEFEDETVVVEIIGQN